MATVDGAELAQITAAIEGAQDLDSVRQNRSGVEEAGDPEILELYCKRLGEKDETKGKYNRVSMALSLNYLTGASAVYYFGNSLANTDDVAASAFVGETDVAVPLRMKFPSGNVDFIAIPGGIDDERGVIRVYSDESLQSVNYAVFAVFRR